MGWAGCWIHVAGEKLLKDKQKNPKTPGEHLEIHRGDAK